MTFETVLEAAKPTLSFWRSQAASMGLDPDDVEQELLIKLEECREKGEQNPEIGASFPVYYKAAARNRVFDMRRGYVRHDAQELALDEHSEDFIPAPHGHRDLSNAEFQIDLERAGLSANAQRFIEIVLQYGVHGGRAEFGGTIRQFYAARDEVIAFLVTRMEE